MTETPYRRRQPLSLFWKGVIILVSFAVVATTAVVLSAPKSIKQLGSEYDAQLAADPILGGTARVLQSDFPNEYAQFRSKAVEAIQAKAHPNRVRALFVTFTREITVERVEDMARSPSGSLKAIRDQKLVVLRMLQGESPDKCARYAKSHGKSADGVSAAAQAAIGQITEAQLRAAVASRTSRTRGLPASVEDENAWIQEMRNGGMTDRQIRLWQDFPWTKAATDEDICATGVMVAEALTRLPPEVADRLTADRLREDAGTKLRSFRATTMEELRRSR